MSTGDAVLLIVLFKKVVLGKLIPLIKMITLGCNYKIMR